MKKFFPFHPVQLFAALSLLTLGSGCETDTRIVTIQNPTIGIAQTGDISAEACTIRFTPDKLTVQTAYAIGSESDRAAFEAGTLAAIQTQQGDKEFSKTFDKLDAEATYIVFARSFDTEGVSGPVTSLRVKKSDEFAVKTQFVLDRSAAFSIKCTSDFYRFRYAAAKAEDRKAFADGTLENTSSRSEVTKYTATCFDLNPGEEYIFFIEGFDRGGKSTGILEIPFTTAAEGTCPGVEVKIDKIDIFQGEYTIIPNAACKLSGVLICPKDKNQELIESDMHWRGDVLAMFDSWINNGATMFTAAGEGTLTAKLQTPDLKTGNQLEAFVVLYGADFKPCGVAHFDFATPAFDDKAGKATATLSVGQITATGATYTLSGGANTFAYMYDTVDADWFDELRKSPEYHDNYLGDTLFANGQYWHYGNAQYSYTEQAGEPGKRYYAAVVPMNANGPHGGWGEMVLVEYTTAQNQ